MWFNCEEKVQRLDDVKKFDFKNRIGIRMSKKYASRLEFKELLKQLRDGSYSTSVKE